MGWKGDCNMLQEKYFSRVLSLVLILAILMAGVVPSSDVYASNEVVSLDIGENRNPESLDYDNDNIDSDQAIPSEVEEQLDILETEIPKRTDFTVKSAYLVDQSRKEFEPGTEVIMEAELEPGDFQLLEALLRDPEGNLTRVEGAGELEDTYRFMFQIPSDAVAGNWTFEEIEAVNADGIISASVKVEFSVVPGEELLTEETTAEQESQTQLLDSTKAVLEDRTSKAEEPKLPIPGNVWVDTVNQTTAVISWNKVETATQYEVYWSVNGKAFIKVASLGSKETSYTRTEIEPNKTHYFKIKVVNKAGEAESRVVQVKPIFSAAQVMNAVSNGVSSIKMSWKKAEGAHGYQIYRAIGNGAFKKIATTAKLTYMDKKVTKGKSYRYKVRAYLNVTEFNGCGKKTVYAPYSNTSKVTVAPKAPSGIQAKSDGYNKVKVSWKKSTGANGYYLYRATSKSGTYKLIATMKSRTKTSYTDKTVKTGTQYYYKVKAYMTLRKKNIGGSDSTIAKAKPLLNKGSGVKATKVTNATLTVTWNKVAGASGYEIYTATKENGSYKQEAILASGKIVKKILGKLSKRHSYYIKVRAYRNVSGKKVYGAFSNITYAEGEHVLLGTNRRKDALEIFDLVNAERKKAGVPALKWDDELFAASELRAAECYVYFSHTRPNGESCFSATEKAYGENIAMGSIDPTWVMSLWMNSPGHRANILNPRFTTIGIGVYSQSAGRNYFTQMFGVDMTNDGRKAGAKNVNAKFNIKIGAGIPGWS